MHHACCPLQTILLAFAVDSQEGMHSAQASQVLMATNIPCWQSTGNAQADLDLPMQVKGNEEIVRLIGTLKPQVVVPLINAGFHAGGPLSKIVAERGSNFDLPQKLKDNALAHVRVEFPSKSGDSKRIRLE